MAHLVDITALSYRYPATQEDALSDVTLRLDTGLHVVAGPSGGGKSTLLRSLNGLIPHLHGGRIGGHVEVAGHDVLRTPVRVMATAVGFVVQDVERQAVHATVEHDIAFALENLGVSPASMRTRVPAVMARLQIAHLRDRAVATLSGGERQRVAVAGALVLEPRLLVLDEPLSQLDAAGVDLLLQLCLELRGQGTALVVSEHRLDDLLPHADSLVVVEGGRVRHDPEVRRLAPRSGSAPQTVRLSERMRWEPVLLTPAEVAHRAALDGQRPGCGAVGATPAAPTAATPASHREPVWQVAGVDLGCLRNVDACGHAGEVVAVMGPNGAGKTTLLRAIAGLLRPRAGTATRAAGRAAYLPQNPAALLHRATVAAEIAPTAASGEGAAGTDELAARLGIQGLLERDPRDLSSGERQRAAVAAILAGDPLIALLDEPTRGMDGRARTAMVEAIRSLASTGTAVVVATHDAELAAEVADRVLVLADGACIDRGPPSEALSGDQPQATQLGRLRLGGAVTVEAAARQLGAPAAKSACW